MDEEIERLLVSVRADTGAFARDVAEMKGQLEGPLADGLERAGRVLEGALLRAVRTGKFGFEDLKRTALAAMAEIAAAAIRGGIQAAAGGGGKGGLLAAAAQLLAAGLGAPGRATGGPVAPGRPYLVGERGPELFVPTQSGRVEAGRGAVREIRMSIAVSAPPGESPQALARSSRQVARAVRQALLQAED
ncbi:MAG TPA: tail tape measure protein [Allosphingosinicella sp.]|jgi:phage-related minor tail protein